MGFQRSSLLGRKRPIHILTKEFHAIRAMLKWIGQTLLPPS
jgi:hypothetical protein